MSARNKTSDTEETRTGTQRLIGGVATITLRDRLACLAAAPMAARAAQKNCDHGLFDLDGRRQTDLIDELRRFNRQSQPSTKENE